LPWHKGRPHNILRGSVESAIPENPLVGPNVSGLSAIQADLVDFVQVLGSKFWVLGGLNQKSKKNSFAECHMVNWRPKNGSIPSRNKKEEAIWRSMTDKQTSGQTDRVNCWQQWLLARRGDQNWEKKQRRKRGFETRVKCRERWSGRDVRWKNVTRPPSRRR